MKTEPKKADDRKTALHERLQEVRRKLASLGANIKVLKAEKEFIQAQIEQIDPTPRFWL